MPMNKSVSVTLQQTEDNDGLYIVHKLVNTLTPSAGSVLNEKKVSDLVADARRTGGKVIILRGNLGK